MKILIVALFVLGLLCIAYSVVADVVLPHENLVGCLGFLFLGIGLITIRSRELKK